MHDDYTNMLMQYTEIFKGSKDGIKFSNEKKLLFFLFLLKT